jgi:hypothetical protein
MTDGPLSEFEFLKGLLEWIDQLQETQALKHKLTERTDVPHIPTFMRSLEKILLERVGFIGAPTEQVVKMHEDRAKRHSTGVLKMRQLAWERHLDCKDE